MTSKAIPVTANMFIELYFNCPKCNMILSDYDSQASYKGDIEQGNIVICECGQKIIIENITD